MFRHLSFVIVPLAIGFAPAFAQQDPEDAFANRAADAVIRASIPAIVEDVESTMDVELALTAPAARNLSAEKQQELVTHLRLFPEIVRYALETGADTVDVGTPSRGLAELIRASESIDTQGILPPTTDEQSLTAKIAEEMAQQFDNAALEPIADFLESDAGQALSYRFMLDVRLDRGLIGSDFTPEQQAEIEAFLETDAGGRFFDSADWMHRMVEREIDQHTQAGALPLVLAFLYRSCEIAGITCESPNDPRLRVLIPAP